MRTRRIKELKGFEKVLDIYLITDTGEVYSEHKKGFLSQGDNGSGYKNIALKLEGCREWKKTYIHRLVALAFIDNPDNLPQVNHIDEDKSNNHYSNLEWMTSLDNNNYGTKSERLRKTKGKLVYVYDYTGKYVGKYHGLSEATRVNLGYRETRGLNRRFKTMFFFDHIPTIDDFVEANKKSLQTTVLIKNIETGEEFILPNRAEASSFFGGNSNITDAINKKYLVNKKFRIYNFDYTLIDSPSLQEDEL